ncbi:hypothetical protein [Flavobacterium okayamense]|uniref:Lipoprotein n=1 Tax=Flavobacterium okayamense TaxID=2830782 RepID=A0ABM7S6B6_9FLAO|nr:hypothetical protein [Flavobacterium okayamense]BCY28884.1 hypothetical protein KK2020170_17520 [Flavobacterium okayamense]
MNRFFLILIVIVNLTSCATKKAEIPSSLDPIHIQNTTNFAKEQFESCMTGKFVPITKEIATPRIVRSWNENEERETCKEINRRFGDLIEFKIVQTAVYKDTYIYRYKANYSKLDKPAEIRVYTTLDHKIDGYIIKEVWLDKYTKFKPSKTKH